ncbi:MAG: hypothetical protein ACLGHQ_14760 [Acidimicrobiia bacterium]
MTEIDEVVRRAVDSITTIAGRAAAFATRILLVTTTVCVGGFLLGIAALTGGIETVWIVLGIVFASIAIGAAFIARWRVGAVRRHVPELVDEVRTLMTDGRDSTRTVIETFAVDPDDADRGSAIVLSRQMYGFRGAVGSGATKATRLAAAVAALTTFPVLVLLAIAITTVFAFSGAVFLLALAL